MAVVVLQLCRRQTRLLRTGRLLQRLTALTTSSPRRHLAASSNDVMIVSTCSSTEIFSAVESCCVMSNDHCRRVIYNVYWRHVIVASYKTCLWYFIKIIIKNRRNHSFCLRLRNVQLCTICCVTCMRLWCKAECCAILCSSFQIVLFY